MREFSAFLMALGLAMFAVFMGQITYNAVKDPQKNLYGAITIWAVVILTVIIYLNIIGG